MSVLHSLTPPLSTNAGVRLGYFAVAAVAILWACAPRPPALPTVQPKPAANSPAPQAMPSRAMAEHVTPRRQPVMGLGRDAYGYLGKRAIVGALQNDGAHWVGSFDWLAGAQPRTFEGDARPSEPDAEMPEIPELPDGRKKHTYLECEFRVGDGSAIANASCLDEDVLELDGDWSLGDQSEPLFMRTPGPDALDIGEYYASALSIPTPEHECPPFVEMLSLSGHADRATALLRMRWPCDPQRDPANEVAVNSGPIRGTSQPSYEAYLADFANDPPHRLLWSANLADLGDPDDANEITLGLSVLDLDPALKLYAARIADGFQSPVTSAASFSATTSVWTVSAQGRYGAKFRLPSTESGHAGWCFASSTSREGWLFDLDGDKMPEIVMKSTTYDRHDAVGKDGNPECVDGPAKVVFTSYRMNRNTLTWSPGPTPRGLTEKRLERATRLEL